MKDVPRDIVDVIQHSMTQERPENRPEQEIMEIEFSFFEECAKHIIKQRKRLGGDWVKIRNTCTVTWVSFTDSQKSLALNDLALKSWSDWISTELKKQGHWS